MKGNIFVGLGVFLSTLLLLYLVLNSNFSALSKFMISVILLLASSKLLQMVFGFDTEMGMILLRSKLGIELIESLAKNQHLLDSLHDYFLSFSLGLASFFFIKGGYKRKTIFVLLGLFTLFILTFILSPVMFQLLSFSLNLPVSGSSTAPVQSDNPISLYLPLLITFVLGLFGQIYLAILSFGLKTALLIFSLLTSNGNLSTVQPGATIILPGINLPLIEGIISLVIILVIHEGGHAIFSSRHKIPILNTGLVLFGILPMGAFVEPDEKKLDRSKPEVVRSVVLAGPGFNILLSLFLFFVLIAYNLAFDQYKEQGWLVLAGMNKTIIQEINGVPVYEWNSTLSPGEKVELLTSDGLIEKTANEEGKIGILYVPLNSFFVSVFKIGFLNSIYSILSITFALSYVIGVVNLIPLPFFDGFRFLTTLVKDNRLVKVLSAVALISFLMNLLPWLFK